MKINSSLIPFACLLFLGGLVYSIAKSAPILNTCDVGLAHVYGILIGVCAAGTALTLGILLSKK